MIFIPYFLCEESYVTGGKTFMRLFQITILFIALLFTMALPAYAGVSTGLEWQYRTDGDSSMNTVNLGLDITKRWSIKGIYNHDDNFLTADFIYSKNAGSRVEKYLGFGVRDVLRKSDQQLSVGEKIEVLAGLALNLGSNPRNGIFLAMEAKAVPDNLFHDSNPDFLKPTVSISLNYRISSYPTPKRKTQVITPANISTRDFQLLARLVTAEAGDEPLEGQVAVAAVVLNRVNDSGFPNTIQGVIYQEGQFKCLPKLSNTIPSESSLQATAAALNGQDPSHGALYYYNPKLSSQEGLAFFNSGKLKTTAQIGHHIFMTDRNRSK
jgi:N-acetylmuramoyl-L-alanine amidase